MKVDFRENNIDVVDELRTTKMLLFSRVRRDSIVLQNVYSRSTRPEECRSPAFIDRDYTKAPNIVVVHSAVAVQPNQPKHVSTNKSPNCFGAKLK